jgi:acylphosphatase
MRLFIKKVDFSKRREEMNKCLRIVLSGEFPDSFLHKIVQANAQKLKLEGTGQVVTAEKQLRIIVCGAKNNVDAFIDVLHKGMAQVAAENIEIEPFLKDKDYRGVFRVIE